MSELNPFPCAKCGGHTEVRDSRPTTYRGAQTIRRRRRCKACGHRVTTFEIVDHGDELVDTRLPKVIAAAREAKIALDEMILRFDGEEERG